MKLLYITNDLCVKGGVERILSDNINHLVQNCACEVFVATVSPNTESAYWYDERVHILPVNFRHSNLKVVGKLLEMYYFGKALSSVISELRPDVVVKVQTSGYSWVIPMVKRSVPKILWVHTSKMGLEITLKKNLNAVFNFFYWKTCRFFMQLYTKVVLLTEDDRRDWNLSNGVVIGNFTNYENSADRISPLTHKQAICIARYDYFKRLDLLVDIWQIVHATHPEWTLHVYGGQGDAKTNVETLVHERNLQDTIILHGSTSRIDEKLLESSVFCFTSQFEGFGLVLIEAMQFGLPVIAFSTVGVNAIVQDGHNGYLIPFGDTSAYAQKLSALLSSYDTRRRMGTNAKHSLTPFSKAEIMKEWMFLFTSLIK